MLFTILRDWVLPGTLIMLCFAICMMLLMPISLVIGHIVGAFYEGTRDEKSFRS